MKRNLIVEVLGRWCPEAFGLLAVVCLELNYRRVQHRPGRKEGACRF